MADFPPLAVDVVIARHQARLERETDPTVIFLGPRCEVITGEGRQWCEDPQPCDDDTCPHKPVKYIRADLVIQYIDPNAKP